MDNKPHENTLKFIKDIKKGHKRIVKFLGEEIIINQNVFPVDSEFSYSSKITARAIPKNPGVVLDVGTGTGVQAIIAAKRGAKKVLAIDIDDNSLNNAYENIKFHKLDKIIKIRKSNLFENIKSNEKFNLIISQLPFANVEHKDKISYFLFDPDFKIHTKFLKEAKNHLTDNGIILIPTGTVGDEDRLNKLIKKNNYEIGKIYEEKYNNLTWKVYILKYKT